MLAQEKAIALAGRAVDAALDPSVEPVKAANLALNIISEADPQQTASLSISQEIDPSTASYSEIKTFLEGLGQAVPELDQPSNEG